MTKNNFVKAVVFKVILFVISFEAKFVLGCYVCKKIEQLIKKIPDDKIALSSFCCC